jgi:hypothetical protein
MRPAFGAYLFCVVVFVKGLNDEREAKGLLFGNLTFADNGDALQSFAVPLVFAAGAGSGGGSASTSATSEVAGSGGGGARSFRFEEVRVLENHGHPSYTCLYFVRVHGTPVPDTPPHA